MYDKVFVIGPKIKHILQITLIVQKGGICNLLYSCQLCSSYTWVFCLLNLKIMNNCHFFFHPHISSILLLIYMSHINPKLGLWIKALNNWESHSFKFDLVITSDKSPQTIPKFSSRTVVILILKKGKDIAQIT